MKKTILFFTLACTSFASSAATNPVIKQFLTARVQYGLLVDTCKSGSNLTNLKGSRDFAIAYANSEIDKHSNLITKYSTEYASKKQLTLNDAALLRTSTNALQGASLLIDYVLSNPDFKTTDAGYDLYFSLVSDETNNVKSNPSLCNKYQKQFTTLSKFARQSLKIK